MLKRSFGSHSMLGGLIQGRLPGQLVIQMTDRCNARCPQCGMRVTEDFPRSTLAVDLVKRILDAAAERGFRAVSFTGGEPFLFLEQLAELITHARSVGIEYIRTGTNGFLFANPDSPHFDSRVKRAVETLAATPLRNLWISIDSAVPAVHEEMRGLPGVIKGIERALPVFHDHGIYPAANLGLNRNIGGGAAGNALAETQEYPLSIYDEFRRGLRKFYGFVIDLGFTMVNTCYPMSTEPEAEGASPDAVYAATSTDRVVRFTETERVLLFKALFDTIPEYRSEVRVFSPRTSLYALMGQYSTSAHKAYPCRGGIDFFFVDARDGNTYPCGYRGQENLGRLWDLDLDSVDTAEVCKRCDWECFRDPSELAGPALQAWGNPLALLAKLYKDRTYARLWWEDLKYYRACGLFDGREAPDLQRLGKFEAKLPARATVGGQLLENLDGLGVDW